MHAHKHTESRETVGKTKYEPAMWIVDSLIILCKDDYQSLLGHDLFYISWCRDFSENNSSMFIGVFKASIWTIEN